MPLTSGLIAWPIRFSAASYVLRVTANAAAENLTFPASGSLSTTSDYYMTGDGQADDLVTLLAACVQSHTQVTTCTGAITSFRVVLNPDLAITIHWSHANTTLDELIFGWTDDDTASADPQTSPNMPQGIWQPERPFGMDSRDRQPVIGGVAQSVAGDIRISSFGTPYKERDLSFILLPQEKILTEYVDATEPYSAFEYGWVNSMALGRVLRVYSDETALSSGSSAYTSYRVRDLTDPMARSQSYPVFWDVFLRLKRIA